MAFERLLLDPEEMDLSAALDEAAQAANAGARTRALPAGRTLWAEARREDADRPEGFRVWKVSDRQFPLPVVALAWWTDRLGARHYRVFAQRIGRYDSPPLLFLIRQKSVVPLRIVHPERVFPVVRGRKTRPEAFAVCGCGAAGTPEAVGWMGDCCGPCSDRRQEGGREVPINHADILAGPPSETVRVGFTPDGTTLLASSGQGAHAWDLATMQRRSAEIPAAYPYANAIGWDDRRLVARLPTGLFVWDFRAGEQETHLSPDVLALDNLALGGPPGRPLLAGSRWHSAGGDAGLFVWSAQDLGDRRLLYRQETAGAPLVFSRDGRVLAVGRRGTVDLLDAETGGLRTRLELAVDHYPIRIALSADARRVAASYITPERKTVLLRWNLRSDTASPPPAPAGEAPGGLAFSPDGRFLLVGRDPEGRIGVLDGESGRELLALAWHPSLVTYLDFSPDGETLVTAGNDRRIKLWPWRHLIGSLLDGV